MAKKALIAMSGGVDSSVAAFLMKEAGYDCIGVTMKLYDNEEIFRDEDRTCCSPDDIEDARGVAFKLGIPYYVFNCKEDFRNKVIEPFVESYVSGATPNPCIECNRHLKFAHLYERAKILGCDKIVTGHYARILHDGNGWHLMKGRDSRKDQSYVLYSLTRNQLAHTCFPLGDYTKEEIREIAAAQGFYNARKRESQDICFIPDGDYRTFIEKTRGHAVGPGDFTDRTGTRLGEHKGYYGYTIGQRRGLGIPAASRLYVTEIIPEENRVVLGSNEDLFRHDLIAEDFHWIEPVEILNENIELKARTRYHQAESEVKARILDDGNVAVHFLNARRAITKGQAVVLYHDDMVIGGGTIREIPDV